MSASRYPNKAHDCKTPVGPFFQPYTREHLTCPEDLLIFSLNVLIFVAAALGLAAGLGAVADRRGRHGARSVAPGWFLALAATLGGILAGSLMTAWMVASRPAVSDGFSSGKGSSAVSMAVGSAGPEVAVSMEPLQFSAASVTVRPGSWVVFVEPQGVPHFLAYGRWDGSRPEPANPPAAPPILDTLVVHGALRVGPFLQPGLYPIYCTVHPGMEMVVAVQTEPSSGS